MASNGINKQSSASTLRASQHHIANARVIVTRHIVTGISSIVNA